MDSVLLTVWVWLSRTESFLKWNKMAAAHVKPFPWTPIVPGGE